MSDHEKLTEQQIADLLKNVGPIKEPPAEMKARVKTAVREAWLEESRPASRTWMFQVAAALAVVSVGLAMTLRQPPEPTAVAAIDAGAQFLEISTDNQLWQPVTGSKLYEGSQIRVSGSHPASFTFGNGMNVRAKPGAVLKVTGPHEVSLANGSVYLDSYDRPESQQFIVTTTFGSARDIGTQFMVNVTGDESWSVQVRDGEVNVADDYHDLTLAAGDLVTISANDEIDKGAVAPDDNSWHWSEKARPVFNTNGQTLNTYLAWVSRETGKTLKYKTESARQSAAQIEVSGTIDGLTASESLPYVLKTTNLELVEDEENVIMVDLVNR